MPIVGGVLVDAVRKIDQQNCKVNEDNIIEESRRTDDMTYLVPETERSERCHGSGSVLW